MLFLSTFCFASPLFAPEVPEATFEGPLTDAADGGALWAKILRYRDEGLDVQEAFVVGIERVHSEHSPHLDELFGTTTPSSGAFLLHFPLNYEQASGTPILFIHGALDNGSGLLTDLVRDFDEQGRPAFSITFAHPHGDVMFQAEVVANAILAVKHHTGALKVDLVAHSKGGPAALTYVSNFSQATWPTSPYLSSGTIYRGDVRRLLLIGAPLNGLDTSFRWTSSNLASVTAPEQATAPTSWSTYYPLSTASPLVSTDLTAVDYFPRNADPFPGQRQLLHRQPAPLPGATPLLGPLAVQPDWFTTYEGGLGLWSFSAGINDAIAAGGDFIEHLQANGVDPDVQVHLLSGDHAILATQRDGLPPLISESSELLWRQLVDQIDKQITELTVSEDELTGLASGELMLGEVSERSDGLVFYSSSTDSSAVQARGAFVASNQLFHLSHVELVLASDGAGLALIEEADQGGPAWKRAVGTRYIDSNIRQSITSILSDPAPTTTTVTTTTDDTGTGTDTDTGVDSIVIPPPTTKTDDSCGCHTSGTLAWLPWFLVFALRRRDRA